jgi:AmmeMemoRadiSam system protein B
MPATRDGGVRAPAVAGAWYPGSEQALRRTVEEYLARVKVGPIMVPTKTAYIPWATWPLPSTGEHAVRRRLRQPTPG